MFLQLVPKFVYVLVEYLSCVSILTTFKERDLSPVTDKLWRKFYEKQFGVESANAEIKVMRQKKRTIKWKHLYQVGFF